ncbi:hypothetical protein DdX_01027 [Ditylenchus destructor]|uniref:Uncharacterized protein n=1 Tax=Ditylenchus destructor TaxID=166010 RepID=A0AAD4R7S2_9BILA|nr:hypothetical protein DdX_01027 [Ditylenchus destructor]
MAQHLKFYKASEVNVYHDGHEYSFHSKMDASNENGDSQLFASYKCALSVKNRCQSSIRTTGEWEMDGRGREFQQGVFENKNHNHDRYQHLIEEDEKNVDMGEEEACRVHAIFQQLIADAMKESEEEKHDEHMPNKAEEPDVKKESDIHDVTPGVEELLEQFCKQDDKDEDDTEDEQNMNCSNQKTFKGKCHGRSDGDSTDSDENLTPDEVMRLILGQASSSKLNAKQSNIGNRGPPKKGIFGSPTVKPVGSPRQSGNTMNKRGGRAHQSASRLFMPSTPMNKPSSSMPRQNNRPHQTGDSVPKRNVHFQDEDVNKKKNAEPQNPFANSKGPHQCGNRKVHRYSGDSCLIL